MELEKVLKRRQTNLRNTLQFQCFSITLQAMTKRDTDIAYFLSFCIEQYKRHISTSGSDVMALFVQYGVDQYLVDNFDILHTQSYQWLMEEIDEFIKRAKEESV